MKEVETSGLNLQKLQDLNQQHPLLYIRSIVKGKLTEEKCSASMISSANQAQSMNEREKLKGCTLLQGRAPLAHPFPKKAATIPARVQYQQIYLNLLG
ncbi:uncharacterized protein MEPE_05691 [Melanopsichium pennsylvanicum]|uniref:Uncharacterized protein n=1 Tax=Melanopsichium pennsylvanicum TaxID=63383 RepID=A0AAJ4XSE2_9BASI|nr:uncharacterized protein MEPE_05691 [Melanopsichium pennsylvanicum]